MGWFKKSSPRSVAGKAKNFSDDHYSQFSDEVVTETQQQRDGDYVAPSQASQQQQQRVTEPAVTTDSDEEMVVVSSTEKSGDASEEETYAELDGKMTSYTNGDEPDIRNFATTGKQSHLNSLFNGHLMKWKFEAEEGSPFLRIPSFFGALGLLVTAILAVVLYPDAWEPHSIVMTICVVVMAIFILVLEGRFLLSNPLGARAHLRNIMTRNFNILRFLWGRGLLYICAGTLNVAQTWLMTIISGGIMIFMGLLSVVVGVHASRKFAALRNSLSDENYLLLIFSNFDYNSDGYLNAQEFAGLLKYLGMELDDRYTLKAFNVIDNEGQRKISFDEYNHWWTSGYIERGRKDADFADEDDSRGGAMA